jgi:putative intracellular protease/amidase
MVPRENPPNPCARAPQLTYWPEFTHPYAALEGTTSITVASPLGGKAPLNEYSVEESKTDELSMRFVEHRSDIWADTEKLSDFRGRAGEFDAIVYAGGQ